MISFADGRCALSGPVTMANARALLEEGGRVLTAAEITVDLSGVTEVDSAAVSLLLEWRRQAQRANRTIRYTHLPANLKSLATVYGVTELISDE